MLNVSEWASENLPEDANDDVALTEKERNDAERLLNLLQVLDEEPIRMVGLTDTSIEVLQHGLMLIKSVMDHRIDFLQRAQQGNEYAGEKDNDITERQSNIRVVRQLYAHLEHAKDQLPI